MRTRFFVFMLLLFLLIPAFSGCAAPGTERRSCEWYDLFDTASSLVCYGVDEDTFALYRDTAYGVLKGYHEDLNIYEEFENNLYVINQNAGVRPVSVSDRLFACLKWGKEAYTLSSGKVNVALGPVLSVWHTYREKGLASPQEASLPSDRELAEAALHTSIDTLVLDAEKQTAYLTDPLASLDFGALAKGYAADQAAEALKEAGCKNAILSLGGNVVCIGPEDLRGKDSFTVGIQDPEDSSAIRTTLRVRSSSVVTSGDYQRYYVVNGRSYHHILDPDTLYPAEGYHSVTVVCASSKEADLLSTALFLLPVEEGKALLERRGAQALWITEDGDEYRTDGFGDMER